MLNQTKTTTKYVLRKNIKIILIKVRANSYLSKEGGFAWTTLKP